MRNEALAKVLAHNICVLVAEMYEMGISPAFGSDETPHVLAFHAEV
jgi:hypothetical protein